MSFGSPLDPGPLLSTLCRVPSPSLRERGVGEVVLSTLRDLGFEPSVDSAGEAIGGDQGNIAVTIPSASGKAEGGILLAAHLDTVPPVGEPVPVLEGGVWSNGGPGILGVDNKAAVAALLCSAARWTVSPPDVPVHLVFTVAEEIGLKGAKEFDPGSLRPTAAFVFDHPTPIGTLVSSSPTHTSISARFRGVAAHAGVAPEAGANAIAAAATAIGLFPQGRISETATGNVGVIEGGSSPNVTAEHCRIDAELRGVDEQEHSDLLLEVGDAMQSAAEAHGCSVEVTFERSFEGYDHRSGHVGVRIAEVALRAIGRGPTAVSSAGGSDANVFETFGIPSVNLGDGSIDTHTSTERIAVEDLDLLVELVGALPTAAA